MQFGRVRTCVAGAAHVLLYSAFNVRPCNFRYGLIKLFVSCTVRCTITNLYCNVKRSTVSSTSAGPRTANHSRLSQIISIHDGKSTRSLLLDNKEHREVSSLCFRIVTDRHWTTCKGTLSACLMSGSGVAKHPASSVPFEFYVT